MQYIYLVYQTYVYKILNPNSRLRKQERRTTFYISKVEIHSTLEGYGDTDKYSRKTKMVQVTENSSNPGQKHESS